MFHIIVHSHTINTSTIDNLSAYFYLLSDYYDDVGKESNQLISIYR